MAQDPSPRIPPKTRRELCAFAAELTQEQQGGSWGSPDPDLQSVILTCQAVHFLSSFRDNDSTEAVARGVEWLTQPTVADSEYAYWRYMPLCCAGANATVLQDAIEHLKTTISSEIKHHKNSPLFEYYVFCRIKHGNAHPEIDSSVEKILTALETDVDAGADKLALRLAVVILAEANLAEPVAKAAMERLRAKSSSERLGEICWHSLVATAYVVIDLVPINEKTIPVAIAVPLGEMLEQSVRYLVRKWDQKDFQSQPVAGGTFEKTRYGQIVVARALVDTLDLFDPRWREPFVGNSVEQSRTLSESSSERRSNETKGNDAMDEKSALLHPSVILANAIKAVPAVKYAAGVAGIAAAVAIAGGFFTDYRVTVFGVVLMFGFMIVLVVFSALASAPGRLGSAAMVLAWAFVLLIIATAILILTSFFFDWPRPLDLYFKHG